MAPKPIDTYRRQIERELQPENTSEQTDRRVVVRRAQMQFDTLIPRSPKDHGKIIRQKGRS
jgi:hypothetical protein